MGGNSSQLRSGLLLAGASSAAVLVLVGIIYFIPIVHYLYSYSTRQAFWNNPRFYEGAVSAVERDRPASRSGSYYQIPQRWDFKSPLSPLDIAAIELKGGDVDEILNDPNTFHVYRDDKDTLFVSFRGRASGCHLTYCSRDGDSEVGIISEVGGSASRLKPHWWVVITPK